MTDTDTPTTEEPTETQPTDAVPEPTDDSTDPAEAKAGREAAKYRRQLRETEANLSATSSQLETARRLLAERDLGNLKADAFWKMHPEVSDLLNEDGSVSPDLVAAAARDAYDMLGLPGAFSNTQKGLIGPYVPSEGTLPDRPISAGSDWDDAFKPKAG
jgi:hypothetical protein